MIRPACAVADSGIFLSIIYHIPRQGNIGLILLPRQMMKTARGKHFKIYIGKPIPYQHFNQSKTDTQWAQWLREECYKLKP